MESGNSKLCIFTGEMVGDDMELQSEIRLCAIPKNLALQL